MTSFFAISINTYCIASETAESSLADQAKTRANLILQERASVLPRFFCHNMMAGQHFSKLLSDAVAIREDISKNIGNEDSESFKTLSHKNNYYSLMSECETAFDIARQENSDAKTKYDKILKFTYLFMQAQPFISGSADINEWFTKSFFLYHKLDALQLDFNLLNQEDVTKEKFFAHIEHMLPSVSFSQFADSLPSTSLLKKPISRSEFLGRIDHSQKTLEVGPYYTPILRSSTVKYFDVLDHAGLVKKANSDPSYFEQVSAASLLQIPTIHFVDPHGDMSNIEEKFDIVFSSHNIEHQVYLIKHLQQVSNILALMQIEWVSN